MNHVPSVGLGVIAVIQFPGICKMYEFWQKLMKIDTNYKMR